MSDTDDDPRPDPRTPFLEELLDGVRGGRWSAAGSAPRPRECDVERRRRFLKTALGGAGVAALGPASLAHALLLQEPGGGPTGQRCTTTTTYTSSTSSSSSYPSLPSASWSIIESCFIGNGGSQTYVDSWSFAGGFGGVDPTSTFSGSKSNTWGQPGTHTELWSECVDGWRTRTWSFPSHPSFGSSYSATESGTSTVTCESQEPRPPQPVTVRAERALPPTLDADRDLLEFRTRVRRHEYRLQLLGR